MLSTVHTGPPRQGLVLVATPGGALAMGGIDAGYNILSDVESFDPASLTWRPARRLQVPRDYFAVTTVPAGLLPCYLGLVHYPTLKMRCPCVRPVKISSEKKFSMIERSEKKVE